MRRNAQLVLLTGTIAAIICIVLSELLIAWLSPQRTMFPRREFSAEYGFANFKNTKTIHEVLGEWRYVYTTNEYGNRGHSVSISNEYDIPNIVVLGDSNSFGIGVDDGDEYASVLDRRLAGAYNVTNLSVGGWGLTQHIRRYYEFGQLLKPKIVILQYSENDLRDNLNNRVTIINEGKFEFTDSDSGINWIKKYLSHSFIQKSQSYNLLRDSVYTLFAQRHIHNTEEKLVVESGVARVSIREQFYSDLLSLFVNDLSRDAIQVLMISEMPKRPELVNRTIQELETTGTFEFVDIEPVLAGIGDFSSPEGHRWGKSAHNAIGNRLADLLQKNGLDSTR